MLLRTTRKMMKWYRVGLSSRWGNRRVANRTSGRSPAVLVWVFGGDELTGPRPLDRGKKGSKTGDRGHRGNQWKTAQKPDTRRHRTTQEKRSKTGKQRKPGENSGKKTRAV